MMMVPLLMMWCSSFGFEAFAFSVTGRRDLDWGRDYMLAACAGQVVYLILALGFWRGALKSFENRRQAD